MELSQLDERLSELKERQSEGADTTGEIVRLLETVRIASLEEVTAQRHAAAIALLERALRDYPDHAVLRTAAANAYGGMAELSLGWSDFLGQPPDDARLAALESRLRKGIELDPTVADLYWDLAVINGRFRGDYDAAAHNLAKAQSLGYRHPMMPALAQLIRQRPGPQRVDPGGSGGTFPRLLLELFEQTIGPDQWALEAPEWDSATGSAAPRRFADYVLQARRLVEANAVSKQELRHGLEVCRRQTGEARDYGMDLVRQTAVALGDPETDVAATNAYLSLLARMSLSLGGGAEPTPRDLRIARRAAQRGIQIVGEAGRPVDPNVHGDLLIALGQTWARPLEARLDRAMRCYLEALELKEKAGAAADVERLRGLLTRMAGYQSGRTQFAAVMGAGIGGAVDTLRVALEVARWLDDPDLLTHVGLNLAESLGAVRQPLEAIEVIEEVLARNNLDPSRRADARFILASRLSEAGRPEEAATLQEALLTDPALVDDPRVVATLWMNLGSSRLASKDLDGAREALQKALALAPQPEHDQVPLQRVHITAVLGRVECESGHDAAGERLLEQARDLGRDATGFDRLHLEAIAARCFFGMGKTRKALSCIDRAKSWLKFALGDSPSMPTWESLLQEWSDLDAYAVKGHLADGAATSRERALLAAEGAKGRLLAWLKRRHSEKGALESLDPERQQEALATVKRWLARGDRRHLVSLFGAPLGLAVLVTGPTGETEGAWLDDFDYDRFRLDLFEPWEAIMASAIGAGEPHAKRAAGPMTEHVLDRVGQYLWRGSPGLIEGGGELVILPHRLFRSIPVSYARLPTGQRLSELFESVSVAPSLGDLAAAIVAAEGRSSGPAAMRAIVDADGSLPFARFEGFAAVGAESVVSGDDSSVEAIRTALASPGIVLLSCHGDFDENNPWMSAVFASNGDLPLWELIEESTGGVRADLVVLGVCEAGKERRSASDEPLGFRSLLLQCGARAVIAPAWKVDDFASFMYLTHFFDQLRDDVSPAGALSATAAWLRSLTPDKALLHVDEMIRRLERQGGEKAARAVERIRPDLQANRFWLTRLQPEERPFAVYDWAAFQLSGLPT